MSSYTDVVIYAPYMNDSKLIDTLHAKYEGHFYETTRDADTIIPYTISGALNHMDRNELLETIKLGCEYQFMDMKNYSPVIVLTHHEFDSDYAGIVHQLSPYGLWT